MDALLRRDLVEGSEAFERFDALVGKVLSVPRNEILRRDAAYKKPSAFSEKKRGPKPKKPAVSPALPLNSKPKLRAFGPPFRLTVCKLIGDLQSDRKAC
jgi:hypothetical protein